MSAAAIWITLMCGFLVVMARRPSMGVFLLVLQSATLALVAALAARHEPALVRAGIVLAGKTVLIGVAFTFVLRASKWQRPAKAALMPSARAVIAIGIAGVLMALVPPLNLGDRLAEHAAIALVGIGCAIAMTRTSTLLQIVGVMVAENGVVLAALSSERPIPFVIELGVALDAVFVVFIAAALHHRIQAELGAGDESLLRELHD